MPFDHLANANNGNKVKKVSTTTTTLSGRISNLPIYNVSLSRLKYEIGEKLAEVLGSIKPNEDEDLKGGFRQPTLHEDRDGNLPVPPGNGVSYREYFVPGNSLPKPAFLRLVADLRNRRMYVTPTHYDVWIQDREAASRLAENTAVAGTADGAQNPFFLLLVRE